MSNDKTTLADVHPGGRVRLGDQAERARAILANAYEQDGNDAAARSVREDDLMYGSKIAVNAIMAALSAQPSPGGQRDDSDLLANLRAVEEYLYYGDSNPIHTATVHAAINAIATRQPVVEPTIWVSPGQLSAHKDRVPGDGGAYLPARLTRDGQFTKPLYAAPAQAVDLGQFRKVIVKYRDSLTHRRYDAKEIAECNRLLALIDSQAVGYA